MKLLDLLVEEGVEWPEGALYALQKYNKDVVFFKEFPQMFTGWDGIYWPDIYSRSVYQFKSDILAEDAKLCVVTKAGYLEAVTISKEEVDEVFCLEDLISKYKEQINLSKGLKKLSLEYRHDARETLKKVNSLLEDSGLEFSVKEGNKTSLW